MLIMIPKYFYDRCQACSCPLDWLIGGDRFLSSCICGISLENHLQRLPPPHFTTWKHFIFQCSILPQTEEIHFGNSDTSDASCSMQRDACIWNAAGCIINSWARTLKHDSWWNLFPSSHIQGCVISLCETSCSWLLAIPENPEENSLPFKV